MSSKITSDYLGRTAVVYVRQSTMTQVNGNLESQRRQYDLAQAAGGLGFASVTVIDDDLGRSGSGSGDVKAVDKLKQAEKSEPETTEAVEQVAAGGPTGRGLAR